MAIYDIVHLTKYYPSQVEPANDDISLTIEAGEIFGVLGDNGAGKSTLIKQMANLLKPSSGTILLNGKPLDATPLYTPSQIGYMPQSGLALNMLTVGESLYFTAHLRGLSRQQSQRERERLIDRWDLGEIRNKPTSRLSGGQKRLVLLATTVTASPPILILDEPTNDLDPQHRAMVWEHLRQLNGEQGTTIIFITHNAIEAERIIQRVAIMQKGKLLAVGRPGVLKSELNRQLRLEVIFSPQFPPTLPIDRAVFKRELAPGRWQLLIDHGQAATYIAALTSAQYIEDFRLSTATLEDLYFSLATKQA
ncbi:MAG: ABC transporter ATP-binding protein [Anaerolineae bacterium]|nr:ABC transporter ATP-binding protein [Anaerolineae bacterium]